MIWGCLYNDTNIINFNYGEESLPVNDNLLDTKIAALNEKENDSRTLQQRIREARYNLQEIKKIPKKVVGDSDATTWEIPIDRRTQKPFTTAARQKQYDDNIALANKVLSE